MKKDKAHARVSIRVGIACMALTMIVLQNLLGNLAANYARDLLLCLLAGFIGGGAWWLCKAPGSDDQTKN